jgi:hypothetical protein
MSTKAFTIVSAVLVLSGWNCRQSDIPGPRKGSMMPAKTIEQVQQEHTDAWMAIPGVVGTAIGQREGKPCILILTASNTQEVRRKIPSTIEGYPVVVQYIGEVRAREE